MAVVSTVVTLHKNFKQPDKSNKPFGLSENILGMHIHFILLNVFFFLLLEICSSEKRLMHSIFFCLFRLKILLNIPHVYLYIANLHLGYVESVHSVQVFFFLPVCL